MVRAPFEVITVTNQDPTQAAGSAWYIAGYGLRRLRMCSGQFQLAWGYWSQTFLGRMLLSLPSHKFTWRQS